MPESSPTDRAGGCPRCKGCGVVWMGGSLPGAGTVSCAQCKGTGSAMPDPTDLPESAYDVAYKMLSMREPERADVVAAVDAVVVELGLTVEKREPPAGTSITVHDESRLVGPWQPVKGDDGQ